MTLMPAVPSSYGHRVILAGGDISLELRRGGWNRDRPSSLAAIAKPQLVTSVYEALLDAGVEIVITDTAAANTIQQKWLKSEAADLVALNNAAARLSRAAVDQYPAKDRSAWGAIGPVEPLLTLGEIKEAELSTAFREQAQALAEGGVQGILCSRFTELEALRIAVEAVHSATELPVVAGLSFGSGPDFLETPLGTSVAQACAVLKGLNLFAFALDCSPNPDGLGQVLAAVKANTDLPLWATCTAGHLQMEEASLRYSDQPADFVARFKGHAQAGVNFFEGGPGATAAHMAAIATGRKPHKPITRGKSAHPAD
jgi:methionine synthase I (cobalamin-dependent)